MGNCIFRIIFTSICTHKMKTMVEVYNKLRVNCSRAQMTKKTFDTYILQQLIIS
jgi:hypothetical protein